MFLARESCRAWWAFVMSLRCAWPLRRVLYLAAACICPDCEGYRWKGSRSSQVETLVGTFDCQWKNSGQPTIQCPPVRPLGLRLRLPDAAPKFGVCSALPRVLPRTSAGDLLPRTQLRLTVVQNPFIEVSSTAQIIKHSGSVSSGRCAPPTDLPQPRCPAQHSVPMYPPAPLGLKRFSNFETEKGAANLTAKLQTPRLRRCFFSVHHASCQKWCPLRLANP